MNDLKDYVIWNNSTPHCLRFSYPVTTQNQADKIFFELGNDLSPERLEEDGNIPEYEANEKYRYYVRVIKELKKLGFVIRGKALETDGLYGGEY